MGTFDSHFGFVTEKVAFPGVHLQKYSSVFSLDSNPQILSELARLSAHINCKLSPQHIYLEREGVQLSFTGSIRFDLDYCAAKD